MALDMESEFYKLARNILGKPKNLYKMASIGPKSGRLNVMGADGFVVVGSSLIRSFTKGPESKAYKMGRKAGKEIFGSLIKEFDEEIENLPASKLLELGLLLSSTLGYGDLKVKEMKEKKGRIAISASRTIELKYKNAKHHSFTCGLLTGVTTRSMRKEMDGEVVSINKETVEFRFKVAE